MPLALLPLFYTVASHSSSSVVASAKLHVPFPKSPGNPHYVESPAQPIQQITLPPPVSPCLPPLFHCLPGTGISRPAFCWGPNTFSPHYRCFAILLPAHPQYLLLLFL